MMVSPSSMASTLNANVVDLHEEASDKKSKKTKGGNNNSARGGSSGAMEIRSRRIKRGELVLSQHFPVFETAVNLAFSVLVGLILRWIFGLIRSLRLSRVVDGIGGVCCSPYQGLEGDTESSFERLLACVLIKSEGDEAGKLLLTVLMVSLFAAVYKLARYNPEDYSDNQKPTKDAKGRHIYRRIPRQKVKRFFAFFGSVLSALWLFHTPSLLRYFGLFGLIEAAEELSARIVLLGNLIGILSIPESDPLFGHSAIVQNIKNLFLTMFAVMWGLYASMLMECIQETARNAAFVLSLNPSKAKKKKQTPDEMVALMNTRIMLVIQALAPFVIILTFFAESHFAETMAKAARGGGKAKYLQNSGQFVRVGLSWSFLGSSIYTIKALLQSYLDQASTVASAMSIYGDATESKNKEDTGSNKPDPFADRYSRIVPTACKIAAMPAFVFATLAFAHLRGADISMHPGVKKEDVDALSASAVKGLASPYSGEYATWITANNDIQQRQTSHSLLQAASMSRSSWEETPFRDSAHRKITDWFGKDTICNTPTPRAIKSVGRELNYMVLQSNSGQVDEDIALPILNGARLLERASPIPFSLIDVLLNSGYSDTDMSCSTASVEQDKVCVTSKKKYPPIGVIVSSILSHNVLTPTIAILVVETLSLLSSIWWSIWYTAMLVLYLIKIHKASGLHISAS